MQPSPSRKTQGASNPRPALGDCEKNAQPGSASSKKDAKFWLIFASMCICVFLCALEISSVSPAIPAIASALHASEDTWVGSAYALSSAAFLLISGGVAQAFGRRPAVQLTISLFALGSAICGAANSMGMLVAGRTIQGLGGGALQSLSSVVLGDLVTLRDRGLYGGLYVLTWCIATAIGPVIGGSLAAQGQWRWLFYLNLSLSLPALAAVTFLLDLPIPPGSYLEKAMRMNWIGNFLVISSTVAYSIALTWAGIAAPWGSAMVLVPLILGLVGLGVFIVYEAKVAKYPVVPLSLLTNMTSMSGYIQTFCSYIITSAVVYYFPTYFMACKGTSSMMAGIYSLGFISLAPAGILTGLSVRKTGVYRPQMWTGWTLAIVALGLMSTVRATDTPGKSIAFLALLGWGAGMLNGTSLYPIQAPLGVKQNAYAFSFVWFIRSFASMCGITIGSTVLQSALLKRLPTALIQSVPKGTALIYAVVPELSEFSEQTRAEFQVAFAQSFASLWKGLSVTSAIGLLASLFMRGLPLNTRLDPDWALKNEKVVQSMVREQAQAGQQQRRKTSVRIGVEQIREDEVLDISPQAAGVRSRTWLPSFRSFASDWNASALWEAAVLRARAEPVPPLPEGHMPGANANAAATAAAASSRTWNWFPSLQTFRSDELDATIVLEFI